MIWTGNEDHARRSNSTLFAILIYTRDPADPVSTPNTLAPDKPGEPQSLPKLARIARLLAQAGMALDTPLGKAQYSDRNGRHIPIHGGEGAYEGITNFVNYVPNGTTLKPDPACERVKNSHFLTKDGLSDQLLQQFCNGVGIHGARAARGCF